MFILGYWKFLVTYCSYGTVTTAALRDLLILICCLALSAICVEYVCLQKTASQLREILEAGLKQLPYVLHIAFVDENNNLMSLYI